MLSDKEIIERRDAGAIIIEPFNPAQLNSNSYDLTLGPFIARTRPPPTPKTFDPSVFRAFDFFWIEDCRRAGAIIIDPGESILCHSNEFAGGTVQPGNTSRAVNARMQATSTAGRWGLTACRCAGHGDVGYFDRWTLEVQNNGPVALRIPIGAIICQLVFSDVTAPTKTYQQSTGNYQRETNLETLMKNWRPDRMLPKAIKRTTFWPDLYKDLP